ncbi:helix-turn-helix domain-containing protein [Psychromonas sp. 14N.309.X.WAT.B.A12]|uniref:LexA family protein n=1 Tax=Psychromonas sp. 14N.309.X.WAT.B.A12 TaxID=2998322 RepID=UPI0025B077CF|nr:S24 family peptidase [Psychromonas sp. 14N.309.X.WAT.B.A12]MDN2661820.1 helix-turn-helix domain-containing protein [Psychromonas sp. 14N.309.X.WAT.B.A12]
MKNLRIKNRRKELGLTQLDIAEALNVSKASVSLWEKGDTSPKNMHLLSKVLKCDPDWLVSGKGNPEKNTVTPLNKLQGQYPVLDWVQAGNWSAINELAYHEADHYPCPVKCSDKTFLLKVRGQSMAPIFNEGELIFIDPEVDALNGKYVVARLDDENEATLKQLIIEDGHKFLKAANPQWPTPIQPVNGNCTIVGVVIFAGRLF